MYNNSLSSSIANTQQDIFQFQACFLRLLSRVSWMKRKGQILWRSAIMVSEARPTAMTGKPKQQTTTERLLILTAKTQRFPTPRQTNDQGFGLIVLALHCMQ